MRFVPHDEQRTAPSFFPSPPDTCRSFVDRVLHRIAANTHAQCQAKVNTKARAYAGASERALSVMHKKSTALSICTDSRSREIICLLDPCAQRASYAVRFVTHAISHARTNSLSFFPSSSSLSPALVIIKCVDSGSYSQTSMCVHCRAADYSSR